MMRHTSLRKTLKLLAAPIIGITAGVMIASCQDEVSKVGSDLANGEVQIALDSLIWDGSEQYIHRGDQQHLVKCDPIKYETIFNDTVDTRSTTNLIGRISVPEYGDLTCSYVSQLMCTTRLDIPDSIPVEHVDSMRLILSVPRGELTGDSLAPQQLKVYRLTKSLPSDIDNTFNPKGYYDPNNPLGSRSFTLSALGMNDSIYQAKTLINIEIPLSKKMAEETVNAYRNKDTKGIFEWPQTFEEYFPGIYVEPSFGRGCVANIAMTNFVLFYHYKKLETTTTDSTTTSNWVTKVGYTGVFASSPIVLSSNNITYKQSDYLKNLAAQNEAIITTPGGYRVNLEFPAQQLLDIYRKSESKLSVVSDLTFSIPVEEIKNEYDITPPPYLILVRTSKLKEFLASNSLPDNKDSFYAAYNKKDKRYYFSSMRNYMLGLVEKGVKDEDIDFTIIPANLEFEKEEQSNYYNPYSYYGYSSSSTASSTPIKCTPYILKPSMCKLLMDQARTIFTYSTQQMK